MLSNASAALINATKERLNSIEKEKKEGSLRLYVDKVLEALKQLDTKLDIQGEESTTAVESKHLCSSAVPLISFSDCFLALLVIAPAASESVEDEDEKKRARMRSQSLKELIETEAGYFTQLKTLSMRVSTFLSLFPWLLSC